MGLDQYIYTANFKDIKTFKDFPDRFWIKKQSKKTKKSKIILNKLVPNIIQFSGQTFVTNLV